ncbi:MAG: electron transfer flavoprotein subunit alpha/FixB family protein [Oligoflexia bacterium]|nr:electron transfer flavoprotein subunit alpha/FixB family protein [Oligoflexia bacterium]MBF0364415.1 electron transfer flavoprotein subunit alpha/FixB family protein [Oligoflexia bacterium]
MKKNKSVMVFIEYTEESIAEVSLELVCKGKELAEKLQVPLEAIAVGFGANLRRELIKLGQYGCKSVYLIEDERLKHFTSVPYAKAVVETLQRVQPQIVLFGATTTGRDLAPRVASALKCGLTADCTDLQLGEHQIKGQTFHNTLLQIRPAFGGNIVATIVSPEHSPSMATVREGVMRINPPSGNEEHRAAIVDEKVCFDSSSDFPSEVIEIIKSERSVDLKQAKIIVAAGMGAASHEAMALIKELARVIGAEVAVSRPVVDAGILGHDHQVGQTGTTVRPTLYIACGISGQIQHRAGMAESKRIIAINRDPQAPIFSIAHYGIVGDVKDVIPKMIKAYKNK